MSKVFYKNIDEEICIVDSIEELITRQEQAIIRSYTLVWLSENEGWKMAQETELRYKGFAEWYLYFEETKVMTGPFYVKEIETMILNLELEPYLLCWCKGFADWKPLIMTDFEVTFKKLSDNILL
jgi:Asp-tRNA(Asn)/Glu-tRNA(Gln) amidotransferase B subunit